MPNLPMDTCPHRKIQMKPTQSKYKERWKDKPIEILKKKKQRETQTYHKASFRISFSFYFIPSSQTRAKRIWINDFSLKSWSHHKHPINTIRAWLMGFKFLKLQLGSNNYICQQLTKFVILFCQRVQWFNQYFLMFLTRMWMPTVHISSHLTMNYK